MTFDLLRSLRERANLTQEAAASLAGVSRVTWCEWERGSRRPTNDSLKAAARAVGASSEELEQLILAGADRPASRDRSRHESSPPSPPLSGEEA